MNTFFKRRKTWISTAHQGFVQEGIYQNTLPAYLLAAQKGADMIETDARMTKDGILIVNHDPSVKGFDEAGNRVEYIVSETDWADIAKIRFIQGNDEARVPTLSETLHLAYFTGMCINIDLKEGLLHAEEIAQQVTAHGMRGRTVYATNGSGSEAIHKILAIDPEARFIDTKENFTKEKLADVKDYQSKCYVYTGNFSDGNIAEIRKSGCMLATISLNEQNAAAAFKHHPDMAEYPHLYDFEAIDRSILEQVKYQ